jgi:hypothetical protein
VKIIIFFGIRHIYFVPDGCDGELGISCYRVENVQCRLSTSWDEIIFGLLKFPFAPDFCFVSCGGIHSVLARSVLLINCGNALTEIGCPSWLMGQS